MNSVHPVNHKEQIKLQSKSKVPSLRSKHINFKKKAMVNSTEFKDYLNNHERHFQWINYSRLRKKVFCKKNCFHVEIKKYLLLFNSTRSQTFPIKKSTNRPSVSRQRYLCTTFLFPLSQKFKYNYQFICVKER